MLEQEFTTEGIIFMALAWLFVIALVTFAMYKVLKGSKKLEADD